MKTILQRVFLIGSLLSLVGLASTGALFSDVENSTSNVFATGGIDLQIDNSSWYNSEVHEATSWTLADLTDQLFFNFTDLKPGDLSEDTISFHVNNNDHWLCANVELTESGENTINEPESAAGDTTDGIWSGELDEHLEFIFWADDGDNVLEDNETILLNGKPDSLPQNPGIPGVTYAIADSTHNVYSGLPDDPLPGDVPYYIGKAWCFGELTPAPVAAGAGVNPGINPGVTCDGSLETNISQTDTLKGNVSFTAVQSRDLPDYACGQPLVCVETYASTASHNNQGTRKNGSAVLANRSVPSAMFGPPQTSGAPSDVGFPAGSFFSLGFTNGNIVVGFANPFFPNPSGADLQVFEVTGGVYPDEKVKVEVSSSNSGPWTLVSAAATRDEDLELPGSVASAQFVQLTDVSDITLFEPTADAYDVDAVKAGCGVAQ
ncbi:TPA: hypothetical protein DIV55_04410 [Patescibacteria group bacterium]|uniref:Uncharacterized protein n=1 Tax=Candidatus Gottesmanbacteria bacterium GW2011_GWA1_43_11 TaxID=1618436 RepID=A0A0G1CF56_9BACT|nr:MAG: hypothetical protein UV59_C0026G0012 [Candidatus Gottesmanbacteria bacterium GW2011_GWA1_43_11]HCS78956.1 hypothetical protein [Patescibacteria group bacterium]